MNMNINVMISADDDGPSSPIIHFSSPTRLTAGPSNIKMQFLSVPGLTTSAELEVLAATGEKHSGDGEKPRRFSYNTPVRKPSAVEENNSPNSFRRRSLAAIKWSNVVAAARRLSNLSRASSEREPTTDPTKAIAELNAYVAQFRDLLIKIGKSKDGPDLRERIRRVRRYCLDSCRHAVHLILQQVRNNASEEFPIDYIPQLVILFFCTQMLFRELKKCQRLVCTLPVDMSSYYDNRSGLQGVAGGPVGPSSNLGGVLSQIIICRQLNPDFNTEEVCSIEKDISDLFSLLDEMQEFMPKENTQKVLTAEDLYKKSSKLRIRKGSIYRRFGNLCCFPKCRRINMYS